MVVLEIVIRLWSLEFEDCGVYKLIDLDTCTNSVEESS
jgi:hypothetical protein